MSDEFDLRQTTTRMGIARTTWFRFPRAWKPILEHLQSIEGPVTVYVGAVATGEEAYSMAMLLEEYDIPGRVIATDIDPELIALAIEGRTKNTEVAQAIMSAGVARVMKPARTLSHFEQLDEKTFRPSASVRERVTFSVADLRTCTIPTADVVLVRNAWRHLGPDGQRSLHRQLLRLTAGALLVVGSADLVLPQQTADGVVEHLTGLEDELTGFQAQYGGPPLEDGRPDTIGLFIRE
ncbi:MULTISPECIES: CheR family methyltransferase [unclassified Rathayibacter]|uniref:CheR family methyltransferase n=1 Tax=unclassified Rathayibacter TaxID=2609250 RepID=UPI000CE87233|nr:MULTISPECIES: CheR family methyltransferase [unclassified Rathayibacter]PPF32280.1 hypothetical protein C5B93_15920 [Rathayibacter sp. AY1A2]PPI27939.1 hypothetical protein C5D66_15075 [Rathayibacter sp. AY1B4]